MLNYKLLDCLNRFLKILMNSNDPMGGKLVLLMRDFRKILPVVTHGGREVIVEDIVKISDLWQVKFNH